MGGYPESGSGDGGSENMIGIESGYMPPTPKQHQNYINLVQPIVDTLPVVPKSELEQNPGTQQTFGN